MLASVYAPCGEEAGFLLEASESLLEASDGCHLLAGGDYNAVLDPEMDRSSTTTQSTPLATTRLRAFASDLNLVDLWRFQNPSARQHTFHSHRHQSQSRIDYVLISPSLIAMTSPIDFHPILISDHAPIQCAITLTPHKNRATRWRFNTNLLTNQDFLTGIKDSMTRFVENNGAQSRDPQVLWEAAKCVLRGECISFASNLSKGRRERFERLESEVRLLEGVQAQQPTPERRLI